MQSDNIDPQTVEGFGREWAAFDQAALGEREHRALFDAYFSIFPWDRLPPGAEGFDLGCGSGRWAAGVAPRVGRLHCIDPSEQALAIAKHNLRAVPNVHCHLAAADTIPLEDDSQDFGYSLGVLHHIPDTASALADCVRKLKVGAPFLLYLYYNLDGRPTWYRAIWHVTELGRRLLARLPFPVKRAATTTIAGLVYWPLARTARMGERLGLDISQIPLSYYRNLSFYSMRTDALDRFGTRLEQRFSRSQIEEMMNRAGLTDIRFREMEPYWVAVGKRRDGRR